MSIFLWIQSCSQWTASSITLSQKYFVRCVLDATPASNKCLFSTHRKAKKWILTRAVNTNSMQGVVLLSHFWGDPLTDCQIQLIKLILIYNFWLIGALLCSWVYIDLYPLYCRNETSILWFPHLWTMKPTYRIFAEAYIYCVEVLIKANKETMMPIAYTNGGILNTYEG